MEQGIPRKVTANSASRHETRGALRPHRNPDQGLSHAPALNVSTPKRPLGRGAHPARDRIPRARYRNWDSSFARSGEPSARRFFRSVWLVLRSVSGGVRASLAAGAFAGRATRPTDAPQASETCATDRRAGSARAHSCSSHCFTVALPTLGYFRGRGVLYLRGSPVLQLRANGPTWAGDRPVGADGGSDHRLRLGVLSRASSACRFPAGTSDAMVELFGGFATLLTPWPFLYLVGGFLMGLVFGAIPGLTATLAIALLLPFTFGMEITHALIMVYGHLHGRDLRGIHHRDHGEHSRRTVGSHHEHRWPRPDEKGTWRAGPEPRCLRLRHRRHDRRRRPDVAGRAHQPPCASAEDARQVRAGRDGRGHGDHRRAGLAFGARSLRRRWG